MTGIVSEKINMPLNVIFCNIYDIWFVRIIHDKN